MNRPNFIKAGYVWRWVNNVNAGLTGYVAWREAGILETIAYRWFGRAPRAVR